MANTEPPLKKRRLTEQKDSFKLNNNELNAIVTVQLKLTEIKQNLLNQHKSITSIGIYLRDSEPRADHTLQLVKAIDASFDRTSLNTLIKSNIISPYVLCNIGYNKSISKYKILYTFQDNEIVDKIQSHSDKYDALFQVYGVNTTAFNSNDKQNRFVLTSTITEFTNICTRMLSKNDIVSHPQKRIRRFHTFLALSDLPNMHIFTQHLYKWMLIHSKSNNVEIETKIGKIVSKQTNHRLQENNMNHPPFINLRETNCRFVAGVDGDIFSHLISKIFNKYYKNCREIKSEQRVNELKNVSLPKLRYMDSKTMDQMYRNSNIRSTWNLNDGHIRFEKHIQKQRLDSLNISHGTRDYDFRISASRENVVYERVCTQNINLIRFKHRRYYYVEWFSVAITETYSYNKNISAQFIYETQKIFANKTNDMNTKMPMNRSGATRTYEIELEIMKECLAKCVTLYKQDERQMFHDLVHEFAQASFHLVNLTNRFIPIGCKVIAK